VHAGDTSLVCSERSCGTRIRECGSDLLSFAIVGAGNGVTLRDLGIFADEVAETVSPQNTHVSHFYGWMETPGGRILLQRPVRPMPLIAAVLGRSGASRHLQQIAPMTAGLAVQATTGLRDLPVSPWTGLGILAAWAAASLLAGSLLLHLRDA